MNECDTSACHCQIYQNFAYTPSPLSIITNIRDKKLHRHYPGERMLRYSDYFANRLLDNKKIICFNGLR